MKMEMFSRSGILILILFSFNFKSTFQRMRLSTDELENHISPDDLEEFLKINSTTSVFSSEVDTALMEEDTDRLPVPDNVDCFGLGSIWQSMLRSMFNMKPDSSDSVNTHFYFSSRNQRNRVQVYPDKQFGLEWVDFNPKRRTVMIVHGFMSHSNASWVTDMTKAFLDWDDVNIIAVDWCGGGNTWKYWRAVANTRRVGSDVTGFLRQLIATTGARVKDFHFVGHSLGAHISSYVSFHLGGVARITGLDPAQPCFRSASSTERLDETDADFVDVIHTNGRLMMKLGFGLPDPIGHADFYPNGGMKQPGCYNDTKSVWSQFLPINSLQEAICSHGRSYLLFTESLVNNDCSFLAYRWNLTYEGVNASIKIACDTSGLCSEMGIKAVGVKGAPRADGSYFTLTTEKEPYCPTDSERQNPPQDLLKDLLRGFTLDRLTTSTTRVTPAYADPLILEEKNEDNVSTTTQSSAKRWFNILFG